MTNNNMKDEGRILTREELDRMLWGAADILRGTTDAADFKNHILSLLFLKRLELCLLQVRLFQLADVELQKLLLLIRPLML